MTDHVILRGESDYRRSCFIDYLSRTEAIDAIIRLTGADAILPTGGTVPFTILGVFDHTADEGEGGVSVYFYLAADAGSAEEAAFIAAAGGTYTGS